MMKKVVLGIFLVGLTGILVAGAVSRTLDKTEQTAEVQGGQERGRSAEDALVNEGERQGNAQEGGQGNNQGQTADAGNPLDEAVVDEWITLEGTVVAVDEDMLTVILNEGDTLVIEGRALSFAQEQGFAVVVDDRLTLAGSYEDDKFEVGQIENLTTGQAVTLREENGRPLWSGRGRGGRGKS
ncbi:MAG: hypothetical protein K8S97_04495 [Anaerolineae bacterium]|nr:hypothetical protein [Anaerolineae bacterium]